MSSNKLCPILESKLTQGQGDYDVTGTKDVTIKMKQASAAKIGAYPYTVTAKAEGGKESTVSQSMIIFCTGNIVPNYNKNVILELGDGVVKEDTVYASATDYITKSNSDCL